MLIETLALMLATAAPDKPPQALVDPASISLASISLTAPPAYQPNQRAVDNWRTESALALEMDPLAVARRALALETGDPARCVKLNNYWCIKRAGWTGEIAADADGHVAFATAAEGAAVAALLLRRYYVDYNRRSARAIVERWAPAQCLMRPPGLAGAGGKTAPPLPPVSRAGLTQMLPQRVVPMGLAPKGLMNTVRARWLAAHGQMGLAPMREQNELRAEWLAAHGRPGFMKGSGEKEAGRKESARRSGAKSLDMLTTPTIMEGVAEIGGKNRALDRKTASKTGEPMLAPENDLATLTPSPRTSGASLPPLESFDCSGEMARIANYAERLIAGVASGPYDDLQLFTPGGQPTERLAKVMANMAAVEIGPARPRMALIEGAVADLRKLLKNGGADAVSPTADAPSSSTTPPGSAPQPKTASPAPAPSAAVR
jgi:hypothetical protein